MSGSLRRLLVLLPDLNGVGGGNVLAAWALQAVVPGHDVTVLTSRPPRVAAVNRYAGTSLVPGSFRVELVPAWARVLRRVWPTPIALVLRHVLMRAGRRRSAGFDLVVSLDNEVDVGRRALQYVHFPWGFLPRPDVDLRWYHAGGMVAAYYALLRLLFPVSREGIAANETLVNSDWTGRRFVETYGGTTRTVLPPAPGDFPEVPWEERLDRVVVVGRISPEKSLEKVIGIVEGVRACGHGVTLLLAGTRERRGAAGRYADRILALARERSDWIDVRLDVPRGELGTLVAASRWGLHGMAEEHYGMGVAEMVVAGCVPFVPDGGGAVEIVGEMPELRYTSVEDAVSKLVAVRSDPDLLLRLRNALAARRSLLGADRFMREIREVVARFRGDRQEGDPVRPPPESAGEGCRAPEAV
jgi:glycosyltransferase involved in cell wall biosynthesis